jgi:two-component system invasion response regulator UvrY
MIRLAIVDDHPIVRSGLVKILKEEEDMDVVVEANGHVQFYESLKDNQLDVAILDISMPGKNGLEIAKEIKQEYPALKILILSMHPEDRFSVRAFKAGASGYVTKESAAQELVNAIRKIHDGGKYITTSLAEKLVNSFNQDHEKPAHERLSDREFQILCMISSGKKIREIAEELFLSPATVATYRARIFEKMQLKSNVELTNYVLRHNLIE